MNAKKKETFLDYRKRVLDSKSKSFCGAKWYNATLWLGSGATTSCHHPPAHKMDLTEVQKNPKALHNTSHKKEMRRLMQAGEKPSECDYCWKIEALGDESISDRVFKSEIYTELDLAMAFSACAEEDIIPKTLEVAFDRVCNFACSYCNANFSTKWAADLFKNDSYKNLKSDGYQHFTKEYIETDLYKANQMNPYIDAFWKWWPELSQSLQEIRVTGGEPLLNENIWKFFDYFQKNQNPNMTFAINSNLGVDDALIEKLIGQSHFTHKLKIFTSCEAHGKSAEYIRDGLNYEKWKANLEKILSLAKIESCTIMMTINALCLSSITHFLDDVLDLKKKYSDKSLKVSVNLLRFPSFQSVLTLPFEVRKKKAREIENWISLNCNSKIGHHFSDWEVQNLERLISYLKANHESPHLNSSSIEVREKDFKSFYLQYDQRRNKNFEDVFCDDIVEWYKGIKLEEHT